jgi:two-component system sensor histidine kinase BaeS
MRTKLFLSFILIIALAFVSNVVYERLIIRDFDDYLSGTAEDSIYWILASVEGSFQGAEWDRLKLREALHWGLMLGYESFVNDASGNQVLSSADVLFTMNSRMRNRMEAFLKLPSGDGEYTWYPLYVEGQEIGRLYIRPLERIGITPQKEEIFRKRGRQFLVISFLIAGGGALLLSILFTIFLSRPIRRLTASAEKIAKGDFSVHEPLPHRRFRDEIDRLTETFNYMAEALRREDALRKHLTSNIAHELRTPLTIIKGNLDAVEDGIISDPSSIMESIRAEIDRLISLVEGIEDITRAEASFFKKGDPEEIELGEFMESVTSGIRNIVEDKGLYLRVEGPSMKVVTYPEKLHIIVKNLLSNSYKFTRAGGIITTWGRTGDSENRMFFIRVSDSGVGIAPENRERVFDRFYRAGAEGGKGLGLAIVKELSEVMGGNVKVGSSPEGGTAFTVTLPSEDPGYS